MRSTVAQERAQNNPWRFNVNENRLADTVLDGTLDAIATNGAGSALWGSGNPINHWSTQNIGEFQLASAVLYRQGNFVVPTSEDSDGHLQFTMPAGTQVVDPAHGVSQANANRAAMSYDFSFSVGPGITLEDFHAAGNFFRLRVDVDPSEAYNPIELHSVYSVALNAGGSHIAWQDGNGVTFIADDGGNAHVTQNSLNLAFYEAFTPGTGVIAPAGEYGFEVAIVGSNGLAIADLFSDVTLI